MKIQLRKELAGCKRIVVKCGSNVVTRKNGKFDVRKMRILVEDICELVDSGIEIVLVSSGAVNIGKAFLNKMLPADSKVELQQSASAIGQPKLINRYSSLFEDHQHICSQILLTHDDFRSRKRFLHAKQTIDVLLRNKIIPILNENDSISFTEITVGDNDHLAASAAQMCNADALLIITSEKGLYDRNPKEKGAKLIKNVKYGQCLTEIDMSSKTSAGRGGMESKVHAVSKVTPLGIKAIIASKDSDRIVMDPLTMPIGTFFGPESTFHPEKRNAWIISTKKLNCRIEVDKQSFLNVTKGKGLLPAGVKASYGEFYKGDCVDLVYAGASFAVGVCEYNRAEIEKLNESDATEIEDVLGYKISESIVDPRNIVLMGENNNE